MAAKKLRKSCQTVGTEGESIMTDINRQLEVVIMLWNTIFFSFFLFLFCSLERPGLIRAGFGAQHSVYLRFEHLNRCI